MTNNTTWKFDDHDEYGKHYICLKCGCGIVIGHNENPPETCPRCEIREDLQND